MVFLSPIIAILMSFRYTNRFAEELDAIHSEDAARGRRSNPAREETINAILLQEASEFSAGFGLITLTITDVVNNLYGSLSLIQGSSATCF